MVSETLLNDCDETRERLSLYRLDEVGRREAGRIEEHLGVCLACAEELRRLERLDTLLFALPAAEPPPGLWNAVRHRIEEPAPRRAAVGRWGWAFGFSSAMAAAMLALILLVQGPGAPPERGPAPLVVAASPFEGQAALALSGDLFANQPSLGATLALSARDARGGYDRPLTLE